MSENKILKKISSKMILKLIFSFVQQYSKYRFIKYNKALQKKLDINFENSIINYQFNIQTAEEMLLKFSKVKKENLSNLSFQVLFSFKYSYHFPENLDLKYKNSKNIFLTKYKGFKINDYLLPSNFDSINFKDRINILEKNQYFYRYTLNDENIKLINLINKFRKNNNVSELIYNKIENINDYFNIKNMNNKSHLFISSFGEFETKLINDDDNITKILLSEEIKYIMILPKEKYLYIFIYSYYNEKQTYIESDNKIKYNKFHLINDISPILNYETLSQTLKKRLKNILNICYNEEGYQIYSIKNNIVLGVLEGPPDTSYENGYFLFKMLLPENFPFSPPQFIFITKIFHPNISENGFVSADILQNQNKWSPVCRFGSIIYSIQSLLNEPNPDDFLNETAVKLYKEDKQKYDKTVREYTTQFANYSKFMEIVHIMDLKL